MNTLELVVRRGNGSIIQGCANEQAVCWAIRRLVEIVPVKGSEWSVRVVDDAAPG